MFSEESAVSSLAEKVVVPPSPSSALQPSTGSPGLVVIPAGIEGPLTPAPEAGKHFHHREQLQRGHPTIECPAA